MTDTDRATITDLLICCDAWEPATCVMGNVRAGDAARALRALLDRLAEREAECERLRDAAEAHGNALQRAATAAGLLAGDDMHTMLAPAIERLREDAERLDWLAEQLEDVQVADADPTTQHNDNGDDEPWPVLWRRAIDYARGKE